MEIIKHFFEISIIYLTIILLKAPGAASGIFLFFAFFILYKHRNSITVPVELKQVFILFIIYLIFFSVVSDYHSRSVKGTYDSLRALAIFPLTLIFFEKIRSFDKGNTLFLIVTFLYLLGNLFFERSYQGARFWGYHDNPNNVSIEVFFVTCFGLMMVRNNWYEKVIGLLLVGVSILLLFYGNSRGILLGIIVAAVALISVYIKKWHKILLLNILIVISAGIYFFYFNIKSFGLSGREKIWIPLFQHTVDNGLFLGFGINSIKEIILVINSTTQTAHNFFLEVFVASGVIGLLFFLLIIYKLVKYLMAQTYIKHIRFYVSLFGIIALFIAHQFDLKLASYAFLGMYMVFLAGLYVSISPKSNSQAN